MDREREIEKEMNRAGKRKLDQDRKSEKIVPGLDQRK